MLKLPKSIKIGTKVEISGIADGYHVIREINENRNGFKIEMYHGCFQYGDVKSYTNRKVK